MNDRQAAFQDRIDGQFPYDDPVEALTLILEARSIAPEASFAVLYEICIPPRSARAGRGRLMELLGYWAQGFDHPLKPSLMHCAEALIDGRSITRAQGAAIIEQIASFPDAYNALSVAGAAARGDGDEIDVLVQQVQKGWRERA